MGTGRYKELRHALRNEIIEGERNHIDDVLKDLDGDHLDGSEALRLLKQSLETIKEAEEAIDVTSLIEIMRSTGHTIDSPFYVVCRLFLDEDSFNVLSGEPGLFPITGWDT